MHCMCCFRFMAYAIDHEPSCEDPVFWNLPHPTCQPSCFCEWRLNPNPPSKPKLFADLHRIRKVNAPVCLVTIRCREFRTSEKSVPMLIKPHGTQRVKDCLFKWFFQDIYALNLHCDHVFVFETETTFFNFFTRSMLLCSAAPKAYMTDCPAPCAIVCLLKFAKKSDIMGIGVPRPREPKISAFKQPGLAGVWNMAVLQPIP